MEYRYDAVCGLYCGACRVVQADEGGYTDALAEEWGRKPEDLVCHGCKSEVTASFCRDCTFRSCAQSKGIEYCFECGEFPCTTLIDFRDDKSVHHSAVLRNSEAMRQQGVVQWLRDQKERWLCSACGTAFWWYAKVCKTCGASLRDCESEEAEFDSHVDDAK
jgi:hypothetical protein